MTETSPAAVSVARVEEDAPVPDAAQAPLLVRVAVFVVTAGILALSALEGGAYDLVVRHELGLALWWVLGLAAVVGLVPRARPSRLAVATAVVLGLMAVWTALSLTVTSSSERTYVEIARVIHHLAVLLVALAALDRRTWRAAIAGAAAAGIGICAIALTDRLLAYGLSGRDLAQQLGLLRISWPLNYWNALGAWASMSALLALGVSAHARSAVTRGVALAGVPVALTTAYLTYSRASVGGAMLGLIMLVVLSRYRWTLLAHIVVAAAGTLGCVLVVRGAPAIALGTGGQGAGRVVVALVLAAGVAAVVGAGLRIAGIDRVRLPRRSGRAGGAVVAAAAAAGAIVLAITFGPQAVDQFLRPEAQRSASADPVARLTTLSGLRYLHWGTALDVGGDAPLGGTGAGTYEFAWNRAGRNPEFVRDAHSLYLEFFVELGVPGLILTVLFAIAALGTALRARARAPDSGAGFAAAATAALAAYLFGAGIDWLWESTAVTVLALVLVGAAGVSVSKTARPFRIPGRVAAAITAIVACLTLLPGLVSTSSVRESQAAVASGDLRSAFAEAEEAIDVAPWSASAYVQHGLVAERAGRLALARADLKRAGELEPANWRIPLLLARVEAERGRPREALQAFRQARELRPRARIFQ